MKNKRFNSKTMMPTIIGGVAGGVVAAALDSYVLKTMTKPIPSLVKLAAGIAIPMFVKNNAMATAAGDAMIGVAAYNLSIEYIPGMTAIGNVNKVISGPGAKTYMRSVATPQTAPHVINGGKKSPIG